MMVLKSSPTITTKTADANQYYMFWFKATKNRDTCEVNCPYRFFKYSNVWDYHFDNINDSGYSYHMDDGHVCRPVGVQGAKSCVLGGIEYQTSYIKDEWKSKSCPTSDAGCICEGEVGKLECTDCLDILGTGTNYKFWNKFYDGTGRIKQ